MITFARYLNSHLPATELPCSRSQSLSEKLFLSGSLTMTAARLTTIILILLLVCLKIGHSGVKKIKIHVPYYVKHVHHFKKVYVPKIHVIKHEHHHKKEYDHHHHHHEVYKRPYKSYDKSSHEYPDEFLHHDFYYDDIESKSFRTHGKRRSKPWKYRMSGSEQYYGWKDADGSDYKVEDSGEDDDDFTAYRKNYYFKRRADTNDSKDQEHDPEEHENDEEEESEEGEEENPGTEEEEEDDEETEEDTEEDSRDDATTMKPLKLMNKMASVKMASNIMNNSNNNLNNNRSNIIKMEDIISITSTTPKPLR